MRSQSSHHYYSQDESGQTQYRLSVGGPVNQVLLLVFAACILLFLLSFVVPIFRWFFLLGALGGVGVMWYQSAFLQRGRWFISGVFSVLSLISLITFFAGNAGNQAPSASFSTSPPILANYAAGDSNGGLSGYETTPEPVSDGVQVGYVEVQEQTAEGDDSLTQLADASDGMPTDTMTAANGMQVSATGGNSAAETALNAFMTKWQSGIIETMVELTSTSWRNKMSSSNSGPSQNLYWKFSPKKLESWYIDSTSSGTDADESRTISVIADVTTQGTTRTYRYDAIMIREGDSWFVDPDSLASGTRVADETPAPENVAMVGDVLVITPSPAPSPTPETTKGTKLYYNKDGGKYYHINAECPSLDKKYVPLSASFTYGELGDKPYKTLKACTRCNAPAR